MTEAETALEAIGQLPDTEIDIAGAALQLARIDAPEADWRAAEAHLSALARHAVLAARHVDSEDLEARAEALRAVIVGEHGYRGDTLSYDDLANANLIRVIERRRGLPVALGILWLHMARAAGWPAHGVDFPGHFLIALEGGSGKLTLDVFAGGKPMDARSLRALLKRVKGGNAELNPGLLRPMSTRGVLLRLQNNILIRRADEDDLAGALACCKSMLRVAPSQPDLWRRAGLLHQRLDEVSAALASFERFLALVPEGEAASRIRAAIDDLRQRLN